MLSVATARARILSGVTRLPGEMILLEDAAGRTLSENLVARLSQPPFRSSAMDGYALQRIDAEIGIPLKIVGQSAAGRPFLGDLGKVEAVRIFTGAVVPDEADLVIPQENGQRDGETVLFSSIPSQSFVRPEGMDFEKGQAVLNAGALLTASALGLAAAANHRLLPVIRRPRLAILATGDEIVPPGTHASEGQILSSSLYSVRAACLSAGAEVIHLGIAPDTANGLNERIRAAAAIPADILITLGGASVGDHDLVREAFAEVGGGLDFWRIAMRPGKPLIFGKLGAMRVLGLPGNPVSSFVCCWLFVLPLIRALRGIDPEPVTRLARLASTLPANDEREDYLRTRLATSADGQIEAAPLPQQDSSLQATLASADGLIVRPPLAPAAVIGEACTILPFSS